MVTVEYGCKCNTCKDRTGPALLENLHTRSDRLVGRSVSARHPRGDNVLGVIFHTLAETERIAGWHEHQCAFHFINTRLGNRPNLRSLLHRRAGFTPNAVRKRRTWQGRIHGKQGANAVRGDRSGHNSLGLFVLARPAQAISKRHARGAANSTKQHDVKRWRAVTKRGEITALTSNRLGQRLHDITIGARENVHGALSARGIKRGGCNA